MRDRPKQLKGLLTALTVPFDQTGAIDFAAFRSHVLRLTQQGVQGFFVNGTTSEGPYLDLHEKRQVLQIVSEFAHADHVICAACIQPSTDKVRRELDAVMDLGPDYVVAVPPFYYQVSQEAVYKHYEKVSSDCGSMLLAYDIPQHTGNRIDQETRLRLAMNGICSGIKDSTGDFALFSSGILSSSELDNRFAWIQGNDVLDCASLLLGADGMVSGLSNVAPQPFLDLWTAFQDTDQPRMFECQRQINRLAGIVHACGGNPIRAIKAAMAAIWKDPSRLRAPGDSPSTEELDAVANLMGELSLLQR
jgi:4-hydroxy-tetrahydrodipicolinate synthase